MSENTLSRLRQYLDCKGITNRAFEIQFGFSNGSFASQLKRGGTIGVDRLENILCEYKDINIEWLLTGRGNMLTSEDIQLAKPEVEGIFTLKTDRKIDLQSIPLYELDATAGLLALFEDETRQVPISHLQIPNLPACDGALYVRGDSMYPLLKSGDIICYKEVAPSYESILWGEMYLLAFVLDGESYISVKYIQKADEDDKVQLVSHNPHHSPKDIPADAIHALALIKASVRFNTMG